MNARASRFGSVGRPTLPHDGNRKWTTLSAFKASIANDGWHAVRPATTTFKTPADAWRSMVSFEICDGWRHRQLMHPDSEALAYPADWQRGAPLGKLDKDRDVWSQMTSAQLPAVIRFSLSLCNHAAQEGVPLVPQSYWQNTVTIWHLAYGDRLRPMQWQAIEALARKRAHAMKLDLELEPFGHFTVTDQEGECPLASSDDHSPNGPSALPGD